MAKKVRFPLEMEDGAAVRSVEELREHFSLERVLAYIADGKMLTWLRDRYEDDLAEEVAALESSDPLLAKKVCDIFDVTCETKTEVDMELIAERSRKLAILKEFTSEPEILAHVDDVATTQDDLYDLLDEGKTEIYLCGEQFTIPLAKQGIRYIGVNQPMVVIRSSELVNWEQKKIVLTGIKYDEKYLKVMEEKKRDTVGNCSAKEDGCMEDKGKYYMISDMKLERSYKTEIYDSEDRLIVNLNENNDYVITPTLNGNYVYYAAYNNDSFLELHVYDLLRNKEEIIPGKLDEPLFDLDNNGIRACNDDWLVYTVEKNIYVYNLNNKNMRMQKLDYEINPRYLWDEPEQECEIIDKFFFACNCSVRNRIVRINLKTFQIEDVIHEDQNTRIEGRLMKSGDNLYCFSNNLNTSITLYCINGINNLIEKSIIVYFDAENKVHSMRKNPTGGILTTMAGLAIRLEFKYYILDSVYYKNQIYFIMYITENHYKYRFVVCRINLQDEKVKVLDETCIYETTMNAVGKLEVDKGILRYKAYDYSDKESAIISNSISIR